jgi:hypothetical protein
LGTPAIVCANQFIGHLKYIEPTRTRMENLMYDNKIVRRDIEQIYQGLYLEAVCSFERFIENLFIGLLVNRLKHPSSDIVPRITFKSQVVARDVILGGNKYVDWLPYQHTIQRAKAFFRNGLPFTSLNSSEKQVIEQIGYVRNAIAHKSTYAMKIFEEKVIGTIPLPPRDRSPAAFLRSKF